MPPGQPGQPGQGTPGYAGPPRPSGYGPPGYGPPPAAPVPPGYLRPGYGPPPGYQLAAPQPTSPAGLPLASFTDRLLAVLIDGAILGGTVMVLAIPAFVIFFATAGSDFFTTTPGPDGTYPAPDFLDILVPLLLMEAGLLLVAMILQYVYHVEMAKRTGQTIGKRIMKVKITPLDPAGSISRAFLAKRFLVQWGGSLIPGLTYLDGLWQLWDKPYQQCLHDKFAKTVVVKVPA
ncbi:RDD family protein [Plantactinospora soyae]|uniref:RDD family membrane protein YckC n=1 Tax=Plantactinospora soyae TaxID=1544732 RepID=A0A927R671_9ACTN|nr:RDD family protein [Plantactinospora soyae]MBE1486571.1 putative RDD family membrane protein YckC [Plantactinospora soyae]